MNLQAIGQFIASCRKEKGLTQEQFAEKLGVTNRSVSRWENGKTMPDISLYESICRELNITIAELFAAQRATPQNQNAIVNYSMDQILREYARMKKERRIAGIILIVIVSLLLIRSLMYWAVFAGVGAIEIFAPTKKAEGIENYDKQFYLDKYGGDLGSELMVFPDSLEGFSVKKFKSALKTGFFDTDGFILLECTMDQELFDSEAARLAALECTIEDNGQTYTNYVLYEEEVYPYPAYITIDGYDSTYEYALMDEENSRIIYLYISYPNVANLEYAKYLKKDLLTYAKDDSLESFTLYYHTFDGGQSYLYGPNKLTLPLYPVRKSMLY